jgi:ATP-dependent HslUV protease, peptidase subunit HslV
MHLSSYDNLLLHRFTNRNARGGLMMNQFHATTIFAVHHNGQCSMSGDGQVTFGNAVVMKHTAKKVRKIFNGRVLAGFAGSVADAFTLFEMFEGKLEEYNGNLQRAAVELAKQWRSDKVLRKLEAMLIVMNKEDLLLVSGTGEVIEPDDGILAIGSGGNYALAAGRSLKKYAGDHLSAKEIAKASLEIAAEICVYTNHNIIVEEL